MKPCKVLLLLLFYMPLNAAAHMDYTAYTYIGKVRVATESGLMPGEAEKAGMICQLTDKLAKRLNYTDTVLLHFVSAMAYDTKPACYVSFSRMLNGDKRNGEYALLTTDALLIRNIEDNVDASVILKLVEYAITNLSAIKKNQKNVTHKGQRLNWSIPSLDTSVIRHIAASKPSLLVSQMLETKIYCDKTSPDLPNSISWYFQNAQYHVYYNDYSGKPVLLLTVGNVFHLENISSHEAVVVDSDSTFYFVRYGLGPQKAIKSFVRGAPYFKTPVGFIKTIRYNIIIAFNSCFSGYGRYRLFYGVSIIDRVDKIDPLKKWNTWPDYFLIW